MEEPHSLRNCSMKTPTSGIQRALSDLSSCSHHIRLDQASWVSSNDGWILTNDRIALTKTCNTNYKNNHSSNNPDSNLETNAADSSARRSEPCQRGQEPPGFSTLFWWGLWEAPVIRDPAGLKGC